MYYIEKSQKIVLADKSRTKLIDTLSFIPEYKGLEVLETDKKIIECNGELVFEEDVAEELLLEAKAAKYKEANEGARAYLESGEALYEMSWAGMPNLQEPVNKTYHIEATDGNIGKLSAYALGFITGQLGAGDVVYWNTKEDETIALTQEQLGNALAGLGAVQAEVWNVKFPAYLARIEACTTADEVRGIVVDYSLPVEVPEESEAPELNIPGEDGAESEASEELQSGESAPVEEEQDGLIQDE